MTGSDRRTFLKKTGAGVAGIAALGLARTARAGANERIVMAAIGCGGQGTYLAKSFAGQDDVDVAYVCDPDAARGQRAAEAINSIAGRTPKVVADLRQVLDDKSVDAVTVATPDHWHGPATILACEAGKHVYVEKPAAHNVREGRLMIKAARRNNRVVQVGTQSRSAEHVKRAIQLLEGGAIGEVLVAKAWDSQRRNNIGHGSPSEPPAGFDYDLWLGPAPFVAFQSNRHHYNWHWWYDFGTGDMGNDGVHELDVARWGLGVKRHPSRVAAMGGKYFFDDDQQFPDTQYVAFEYDDADTKLGKKQLVFELRIWSPYVQEEHENGNAFYGTDGMLVLSKKGGWKLFGKGNELREQMGSSGLGPAHHRDFIEAIHAGMRPSADIEIGHRSATLCHLGNIAARLGRSLEFDPEDEQFVEDREANRLVQRTYRDGHWAVPDGV